MVGPVPVVMELGAGLCPSFTIAGSVSSSSGQTSFTFSGTPDIAVSATAYLGIGTAVASAGVKGSLTLLDVSTPITNTMVLAGSTVTDTTTGDVNISFLNGEFDLYAKAGWGMFSVEYDYELCSWPGFSWTFPGFSDQKPIAKSLALDIHPANPSAMATATYTYAGPPSPTATSGSTGRATHRGPAPRRSAAGTPRVDPRATCWCRRTATST